MRRWWGIPAVLTVLVAGLTLAGAASAAPYTVSVCQTPTGQGIALSGWTVMRHYGHTRDYCASGGYFGVYPPNGVSAKSRGSYGGWSFTTPAGTTLTGFDVWKNGQANGGGSASTYDWTAGFFLGKVARGGGHAPWACFSAFGGCVHGTPSRESGYFTPLDPRNHLAARGLDEHRVYVAAGCLNAGGQSCPANKSIKTAVRVYRLDLILDDATAPAFTTAPGGGLVDSAHPIAGPQNVLFRATDTGSGVAAAYLVVDGHTVAGNPIGGCAPPYVKPVPCRTATAGGLTFDTSRLRDGAHSVSLVVTDATGVNRATYGPVRVVTRNAVPACRTGAAAGAHVTAGWGKHRRHSASVRYGGRALLHGRVVTAAGAPVAGRTVFLLGRSRRSGAPATTLGSVVSEADGRFHFVVRGLRSRRLRLAFRAVATDTTAACSGRVGEAVRSPVTVAASRRHVSPHGAVAFHGHVRGRPLPRRHRLLLALQGFTGRHWATVKTFRARGTGAYRTTYRFKGGRGRFAFRVLVPRDPTYPFAPSASRSRHIRSR